MQRTSGIRFQSIPTSIVVPATTRAHTVRLSGTPLESGTLQIHGCHVRMLGGCIEEDIVPVKRLLASSITKDGKRKKQTEKERLYGRQQLSFASGTGDSKKGADTQKAAINDS